MVHSFVMQAIGTLGTAPARHRESRHYQIAKRHRRMA
jgi:hypothetical protein